MNIKQNRDDTYLIFFHSSEFTKVVRVIQEIEKGKKEQQDKDAEEIQAVKNTQ